MRFAGWLIFGAWGIALQLRVCADSTAFLDRPIPSAVHVTQFNDRQYDGKTWSDHPYPGISMGNLGWNVKLLEQLSGKRVELPDYIAAAVRRDGAPASNGGSWGFGKDQQVRPIFNRVCFGMGMTWTYDASADAIKLDCLWRRDDSRLGAELTGVLTMVKPVSWEQLPHSDSVNLVGGHGQTPDAWRVAFDALLSRPENIAAAGQVRIYADTHPSSMFIDLPVINLLSKKMRDQSGREVTLVLNTQRPISTKDAPADIAYYLFDEKGRFVKGGVYAMGEGMQGSVMRTQADPSGAVTVDVGWDGFFSHPDHVHFALQNGDLVLTGATRPDGRVMDVAETTSVSNNSHDLPWHGAMGVLKMSVAGAK